MICALCQYESASVDSFVCDECTARELSDYDGSPVVDSHLKCECASLDIMCNSCRAFQERTEHQIRMLTHQEEL